MAELEKIIKELEEVLGNEFEEETPFSELDDQQLMSALQKLDYNIGKKQRRFSIRSEEYAKLKKQRELVEAALNHLIRKEREESGLTAVGNENDETVTDELSGNENQTVADERQTSKEDALQETKEFLFPKEYINSKVDSYKKAIDEQNTKEMQAIYREVYDNIGRTPGQMINLLGLFEKMEKRHKGMPIGLFGEGGERGYHASYINLADAYREGKLVDASYAKSRKFLEKAAEGGRKDHIYALASELDGSSNKYEFPQDLERAYKLFKRYVVENAPLDKTSKMDQASLYRCYCDGAKLGYDMEKEGIPVSWQWLLDCEGKYKDYGKKLHGDILVGQQRYEEAVQAYLEANNKEAIVELEQLVFHSYFRGRPELCQRLEGILEKLRDNPDTPTRIRTELYSWYAWRYENGKQVVENNAIAYAYYLKLLRLATWEGVVRRIKKMTENLSRDQKIIFFKEVLDEGGFEVAKELGDLYRQKSQFEQAVIYYQQGAEYGYREDIKKACSAGYSQCKAIVNKRTLDVEQCEESYRQCLSGIGMKEQAFSRMRSMAKQGNTYAALRFAQVAEEDTYLRNTMRDFPTDKEIFEHYIAAAEAGEREAIMRMVDIYEKGQLGVEARPGHYEVKKWRDKL